MALLPTPIAGRLLRWNAGGTALENVTISDLLDQIARGTAPDPAVQRYWIDTSALVGTTSVTSPGAAIVLAAGLPVVAAQRLAAVAAPGASVALACGVPTVATTSAAQFAVTVPGASIALASSSPLVGTTVAVSPPAPSLLVTGGVPSVSTATNAAIAAPGAAITLSGGTPTVAVQAAASGVSYVGAGALSAASRANNSTFTPELPAGIQANDILILLWGTGTNGASNTNIVSGWTAFGTSFSLNGFPGGGSLLYRRAGSSETAPTLTANGDDGEGPVTTTHVARIFAFRGCVTSGSPLDVAAAANGGSGTSITGTARTTATANAMMTAIGGVADANVSYSSPGGSTDTVVSANSASGSAFLLYDDAPANSAGSKSAPTCTGGTSAAWSVLTFALKPA